MRKPDKEGMGRGGKCLFWLWIAYQTVKGTLTTSLIWAPMIYYYFTE